MSNIFYIFSLFVVFQLFFTVEAHAYLDPGSGSYLIQILVATLAGAGLLARSQWDKIKNIFFGPKNKSSDDHNGR